jgi:hypothetical protein
MSEPTTLADWIEQESRMRGFSSNRQFAEWVGIGHTTTGAILARGKAKPTLATLVKLAEKTGANLFVLVALAYPEYQAQLNLISTVSPGVLLRAQIIEEMPRHVRDIIDGIIRENADKCIEN